MILYSLIAAMTILMACRYRTTEDLRGVVYPAGKRANRVVMDYSNRSRMINILMLVSIFTVLFLWFDSFFFPCSITRSSPLQHPPCLRGYVSVTAERQPQQTAESYRTAFRARYCLRFAAMASLTPGNTL